MRHPLLTAALLSALTGCAADPTPSPLAPAGPMPTREHPAAIPSPAPALPYTARCGAHTEPRHAKPWRVDAASLDRALATGPLVSACLGDELHKDHLTARLLRDTIIACQDRVAGGHAYFELTSTRPDGGKCWGILVTHQQNTDRWLGLSLSAGADYATALYALPPNTAQLLYHGPPWMELACMPPEDIQAMSPADRADTAKATSFTPEQAEV